MPFRICKFCGSIVEDANSCISCGSDDYIIYDEILSLKGSNYSFEQDPKDSSKWNIFGGSEEHHCKVFTSLNSNTTRVECDCTGFKYRRKCKHSLALKEFLESKKKGSIAKAKDVLTVAKKRHPRSEIDALLATLDKDVFKGIDYTPAGSYRRQTPDSKDIDILVVGFKKAVIQSRLSKLYPGGDKPRPGDKVAPSGGQSGDRILRWYCPIGKGGDEIITDFIFTTQSELEPSLLYFTGSKDFNLRIRSLAIKMGYALNRYGLWDRKNRDTLIARSEKDIFKALNLPFIPPEKRNA